MSWKHGRLVAAALAAMLAMGLAMFFAGFLPRRARSQVAPAAVPALPALSEPEEELTAAGDGRAAALSPRRKRWWRGALEWMVYLVLVVAAIVLTPRILVALLDTQYPMAAVTSGSMWPTLHKGDMVILKGVDEPGDLKVGDIIGFRQAGGGFAIHRVIAIHGSEITTKGDANRESDPVISFEDVVGRVPRVSGGIPVLGGKLLKVRYLGYVGILLGPLVSGAGSQGEAPSQPAAEGAAPQDASP